jgi:hypothetical protein
MHAGNYKYSSEWCIYASLHLLALPCLHVMLAACLLSFVYIYILYIYLLSFVYHWYPSNWYPRTCSPACMFNSSLTSSFISKWSSGCSALSLSHFNKFGCFGCLMVMTTFHTSCVLPHSWWSRQRLAPAGCALGNQAMLWTIICLWKDCVLANQVLRVLYLSSIRLVRCLFVVWLSSVTCYI